MISCVYFELELLWAFHIFLKKNVQTFCGLENFLNTILKSDDDQWCICDDSRPSKSSFHLTFSDYRITIPDMIRLKERYRETFKRLNIDCSPYANGFQKYSMVCFKHETDKQSKGLIPITFVNESETHKHLISIDRFHDDFHTWSFSILPFSIF